MLRTLALWSIGPAAEALEEPPFVHALSEASNAQSMIKAPAFFTMLPS